MPETVGLTWNRHRNFCASQSKVSFLLAINFVPRVRFYSVFIILGRLGHEWRGWRYYCSVVVFFFAVGVGVVCSRLFVGRNKFYNFLCVCCVFFRVFCLFWSLCNFYCIVTTVYFMRLVCLFICLFTCLFGVYTFSYLFACLFDCLFVDLFACLIYLFAYLFSYLFACLIVYLFAFLIVYLLCLIV